MLWWTEFKVDRDIILVFYFICHGSSGIPYNDVTEFRE